MGLLRLHRLLRKRLSVVRFVSISSLIGITGLTAIAITARAQDSLTATSAFDRFKPTQTQLEQIRRHGPWPPEPATDPGNELSGSADAERLGESLFNNKQLSARADISCSSCHQARWGFTDNLPLASGIQTHTRNTQSLFNLDQQRWFGWDGGADSLWAASLRPLLSPIEMGSTPSTIAAAIRRDPVFIAQAALAAQRAGDSNLICSNRRSATSVTTDESLMVYGAKAIAAYVRTLRSGPTPFDRLYKEFFNPPARGSATNEYPSYPLAAWRGLGIFSGKGQCHLCHYGPNFSNGEFHDIGRPFIVAPGQVDPGRFRGIQRVQADPYNQLGVFSQRQTNANGEDGCEIRPPAVASLKLGQVNWGQWRTPSLRNLKTTAPYMHDGSLATLRDVVDWYADIDVTRLHANGETILQPLTLSARDRDDLVAFLLSLSP
ncbi:MAG: cytochrome c peroxidase [Burkholderiaceae bacterium]